MRALIEFRSRARPRLGSGTDGRILERSYSWGGMSEAGAVARVAGVDSATDRDGE